MGEVTIDIVERIGVVSVSPSGWRKEINRVSWAGGEAKIDIRDWSEDHKYMSRGMNINDEDAERIAEILNEYFERR